MQFFSTQSSKCYYLSFQSYEIYQEVEELQLFFIVMSGSCNPGKIPEPCQIWISSQNSLFRIVSLDENSSLMDFGISHHNFSISRCYVEFMIVDKG